MQNEFQTHEKFENTFEPQQRNPVTPKTIYSTIVLCICSVFFGINLGYFNALENVFKGDNKTNQKGLFEISDFGWSFAVTSLFIGALISNLLVPYVKKNRKSILIFNNAFYMSGNMCIIFSKGVDLLIIGRILIGLGCGTTCALIPLYFQKIAPPNKKGIYGSLHQLSLCAGIFFATLYSFYFNSNDTWKIGIISMTSILLVHTILLLFIKRVNEESMIGDASFISLFKLRRARLSIFTAIILHAGQQASGIRAVIIFANKIFKENSHPKVCCFFIGFNLVLGTLISMFIVDKFGRKPMVMTSLAICAVSLVFLGFNIYDLLGIFGFILGYSIGMGPIPWFVVGEIFPEKYKKAGTVLGVGSNWISCFLVTVVFAEMFSRWGHKSFFAFFILVSLLSVFVRFFFRETKGRKSDFI